MVHVVMTILHLDRTINNMAKAILELDRPGCED